MLLIKISLNTVVRAMAYQGYLLTLSLCQDGLREQPTAGAVRHFRMR
jgi:hypothetical protein